MSGKVVLLANIQTMDNFILECISFGDNTALIDKKLVHEFLKKVFTICFLLILHAIASLLHCLHQLKSENHRLDGHIKSLATRRDHLLAVNARLSIPFSSPLHADSFLSSDKPTDGKTAEPSLMQDVACLTADNPVQAGGSTTVPAVTCVSSLPPMTSVLNLSVSNTLSAMDSTPTSMEVTLPSSSTPDKSKPDVT
ncbi:protein AF-10-like [Magallana gigas]|uniref:protein AF-10-like n=1 Tax=Magallana gigas TaxID=29159 RepID=UPI00333E81CF